MRSALQSRPELGIGPRDLNRLSPAERHQLLLEWNDTGTDYGSPGRRCLHQLIESQVDRAPGAVAVVCDGRSLTYGELDRRANRLAHRLLRLGVQPESPVGICAERSLELMVGLLAILKAGGAYVPLDPEYPRDRLAFMVEDALAGLATPVLLTQGRLLTVVPESRARIVLLDAAADEGNEEDEPGTRPAVPIHLDQVAYLIYTSGSTGRPKGVMSSHRGIVNRLLWMQETYRLDASDRVLQKTPASFDVSVWEFFWPLLTGARLVMALPGGHRDPSYLARMIAEEGVTTVHFVPSMLSLFLEAPEAGHCASLRRVVCSGEALPHELQQRFYQRLACPLHNLYGPTEAAVDVTFWACRPGGPPVVPIGRPVANTCIHLLNADRRPVPAGAEAELYIGGVQVARGYWHRPDLTAERFVPDPCSAEPGSRLYKTGDLARHRPDGGVEYLGRLDDQVKVRGVRIELGEIEAVLAEHPEVREAVVVAREDGPGNKRLAAYFVAHGERQPASAELRSFLGSRLPEPMIPAFFLGIPELPLTPNGKADRKALTQRELPRDSTAGELTAPRNPTEELLAGIWQEVLGRDRVGIDESFLDLGGDSLLATRVQARVRAALGLDLPPASVLAAATVAALAEKVEQALAAGRPASPSLPPITPWPRDRRGEPLSLAQRRIWFVEQLVPGTPASNIPIVMRFDGPLSLAVLERSLAAIACRHEALRTTVELGTAGEPLQIVAPPSAFRLPLADLSGLPVLQRPEERQRLALAEARRPIDPGGGALWRRLLLREGERKHELLVTFHHVIADGESVNVFERELAALYAAFLQGRPSALPALPVQPADVALWEHGLSPEVTAPHLAYFRQHLAGAPAALDLPADLPRPAARTWRGVSHALALPPTVVRDVRDFARRRGATAYMAFLASWVAFLRRITGQDDSVVGTVVAHRRQPELERLIGFFANSLPLRVERSGDANFGDLLALVRTATLGLLAHQDLPLEPLAEVLRPGRAASAEPLFQAFFALHGNAGRRQLAPGLTLAWREEDHGAAQFDFLLDLEDGGEEISGRLVASADLFTPATVQRLARGWAALLAGAVAWPEAPLSTLALLGAAERHAVLAEWSRAPRPPVWSGSVPARIAAWAQAAPGAIAVLPAEPGLPALTYGELVARAHRLAGELRARGVGPGVQAGIYAERTPETLVGMLAVLAAGGAFLPLDPAYPPERLAMILDDARVPLLLARPGLAAALPRGNAELVLLDPLDHASELAAIPETLEDSAPGDLAYVIYTSGSTGKPKGVLIPHRGFLWAVEALAERSGLRPESRVLQFAAASFDASVWEIWSALISGATLVLARPEELLPGPALLATLRRRGITNVFLTPTALAAMPEEASRELPDLRGLVVGGEAFPSDLVERWAAGRRLWNAYGPTEASICVTMARLGADGQTPIGRPVADSRLLVLGIHLELLPQGVPGELYLGGAGLAHGYLGKPDLTARAFLPDPFSGEAGARLYRTGDLVRFRADGQLEFLGRADRQVKVRGFRIEPGEVEAQIAEHPDVHEAVVVPYEAAPGDLRLAAYLTGGAGAQELRAFLRARLPEHMVPSSFAFLAALPLTPGGKVDRRALPPPGPDEPAAASGAAAQRTPSEELLAGIWGEVLGRAEVGAADDFFDLGGHSLLIGQVLARVRAVFGVELTVRAAFEARTLAALARRIEETRHAGGGGPEPPPLVRIPRDGPLPLSFGQERLWFLHRLDPDSPAYNLPVAFDLPGSLDAGALAHALAGIAERHEVLRTTYADVLDEAVQIIHPPPPPQLPLLDLSGLPAARRSAAADLAVAAEARRPFDLIQGPVLRPLLLRLAEREHRLLLNFHHIAADAWSIGVVMAELRALYTAFHTGRPTALPEPAVQVADFAGWQRAWLQGAALGQLLAQWTDRIAGAPTALELPADRPRPAVRSDRGRVLSAWLPAPLAGAVRDLGRREGATPFMILLAALAALLGRSTGQRDILLGTPIAGRNRAELEGLIGFLVNTLVLRCDLGAGDLSFRELLARLREECLAAYGVQDLPLEKLVERLQPQRDPSRNPLFQVLFVFQSSPLPGAAEPEELSLETVEVETGTSKLDLTLDAIPAAGGEIRLLFEYSTDLFDAATIGRLASHLRRLLEDAAARPGERLGDLALLSPAESQQLLREWSDTGTAYGSPGCLHQLIESQVDRTPDAVAVVCDGRSLTYAELDRRANRLAHRLLQLGVQPESPVGICAERSLELVIALLAILKAGGAYVPLDPEYPRDRLAFMLDDALAGLAAPVLLTQGRLLPVLPETCMRRVLLDAAAGEAEGNEPCSRPAVPAHLDQVAYLIYTSGSTGRPKGVMNSHRGIVNRLLWMQETYRLDASDRVLQKTPASFDVSVWEFFWPLLTGSRLVMALPGGHRDPSYLAHAIAEEGVTTAHFVPSMLSLFLEAPGAERCTGLRRVVCSGEALSSELQQRFHARLACPLHNLYGPTEAAVDVTFWACRRDGTPVVPIGRPVANTRIHLLDAALRPVPVGVAGELHIGGVQLARGYWRRPELTAERFVPDPCSAEPGSRLYKTGDLARHRPDGGIEYLGRLDDQVKVRGVRVELGEIEAVLAEHPDVREAVVAARPAAGGDTRLVAWVVAAAGATPDRRRLRAYLEGLLPEPMVPAAWVFLAAMPLTPSGKVDRRSLPEPEAESRAAAGTFAAPRTPVEEVVAGIWSEVLGIEAVAATDHFFALGGHSLLAARVVSRLRAACGVEIPLRRLFDAPTVALLAEVVEAAQRAAGAAAAPLLEPVPRTASLPLSFAQQRLWLLDRLEPGSAVYNLPLPNLIRGTLDAAALERALGEVVRRHEVLRTTFAVVAASGEPRLAVAAPGAFSMPRVDLSGLPQPARTVEAERLNAEESLRPFDLAAGPLFRAMLLVTGEAEQSLLMTLHHIAGDGWSIEVLLSELSKLYQAFAAGRPSPLPELAIQYADYAVWQRRLLAGPVLAAQLAYWRRQLAGAPEALDLPTDRPRPAVETPHGSQLVRLISPALVAEAGNLSRHRGTTLFMALLAGFAAQLHRYSGAEDILLGSPVANRGRGEIEGLIGFFVNLLVLRADLSGDPSLETLLARVREVALGAYGHQDLPFERLVEDLQPQRSLARSPLFQVQFVLGVGERERELAPGLTLVPLAAETRTAKYDLTLALDARDGGLIATLEYRTDLFEAATMVRWLGHFEALFAAAVAAPLERLSALSLLAAPERQMLLQEWNDTAAAPPDDLLHGLFERQARVTPGAPALVCGQARLTYAELDAAAEHLARFLRGRGVGAEVPVGVCLDRTAYLVIALLAVLKAGGAYVPVDPRYPEDRRRFLLADSGAAVVLTRTALLPLVAGSLAEPVCLDAGWEETAGIPRPATASARNLAYLIYTSGSTGKPKGVAIEHRSAVALVHWARSVFSPADLRSVLAATSICFDLSVFELFVPLSAGGAVHLVDNALALTGGSRGGFEGLTLINTVPSAMAELVNSQAVPASVQTVSLAGEPLPRALVDRIYELGTVERVLNLYGPSEDTTYSTWAVIPRGTAAAPSIGRPVDGTRAYLVDRHLEPVALGIPGEVLLAGAGLARGYHGRPDLTAERFLPAPFAAEPGGRLYRTGDLARYRKDGEIEFLGRIDHQVKLRGFRIELGEVEAALASHPAVERAVVATHAFGPEDVRLAAWVMPAPGQAVAAEALRAWVGERLPEFMVPSAVVVLPALPLTPNGKVDRRALPPPVASGRQRAADTEPRSPLEELVAGLWAELLGVERVGLHDDFFALGGHSLLAIRQLARLAAATGVDLPLRALFAHPTVASLAAEVERILRAPGAPSLPPVEPAAAGDDAPASSAQERLWLFQQLDPAGAVLNVPHALRLTGALQPAVLAACLAEIARRHASLRTSFAYAEEGLRQRIAPPGALALPVADLGALLPAQREEEARRATEAEAREPFDLAAGPLWRARLLRLDDGEHRLLLTFHHIIVDGWSVELFDRELAALYPAAESASPLPEPALQYADFAVWQRRWLSRETLAPQLAYWRRQLAGMPLALDLPTDRPRPARQSFRGAARTLLLPPQLAAGMKELGRREGSSLFMTVFAAFAVLLGCYTGRTDVVLGSPAANRHRPGTEGLIGFFVDNLVLRLDLAGDPTVRELLRRAREVALGAFAHPDVPFEHLVEELDPARDKSRSPLVQVLLLVQAVPGEPLRLGEIAVEPVEVHTATSQFDLTLFAGDGPGGLTLVAEYSTDLFAGETVDRMLAHLSLLLAAVVANPELRLSEMPAEIAPRPRLEAAMPAAPEAAGEAVGMPENDRARRQALLAERRSRLAADDKDLLESRLRRRG